MINTRVYTANEIKKWDIDEKIEDYYGREYWQPARPLARSISLKDRIAIAWKVFTGEYDALNWENRAK